MPRTGGRGAGEGGQNPTGAMDVAFSPIQVEPHPRRAVCCESSLHGSGRDRWKRVYSVVNVQLSRYRAGRLLHWVLFQPNGAGSRQERRAWVKRSRSIPTLLVRHVGQGQAPCQCALMHRTVKPKLHTSTGMQSCGGVQMQASGFSPEVIDMYMSASTHPHSISLLLLHP